MQTSWSKQRESGYTVAEVLVVAALASLIMVTTLLSADAVLPQWRLRSAAMSVASTLRFARVQALRGRREISVPFDVAEGRYAVFDAELAGAVRTQSLPPGVTFEHPLGTNAVTLVVPGTSDTAAIFNRLGLLRSDQPAPGYIYLGCPEDEAYRRVRLSLGGTVKIETWNGAQWR